MRNVVKFIKSLLLIAFVLFINVNVVEAYKVSVDACMDVDDLDGLDAIENSDRNVFYHESAIIDNVGIYAKGDFYAKYINKTNNTKGIQFDFGNYKEGIYNWMIYSCNNTTGICSNGEHKDTLYGFAYYPLKDKHGDVYAAYCRNPGVPSGIVEENTKFCVTDILGDTAYERGVIAILNAGHQGDIVNDDYDQRKLYLATNMALRVYEMADSSSTIHSGETGKDADTANKNVQYVFQRGYQNIMASKIDGINSSLTKNIMRNIVWYNKKGSKITTDINDKVEKLVKIGLAAKKATTAAKISKGTITESNVTTSADGLKYSKTITIPVTISNFINNASVIVDLNCTNCTMKIGNKTIKDGDDLLKKITSLNDGSGTINIKLTFTQNVNGCVNPNYTLKLNYKDDSISTKAYTVRSRGEETTNSKTGKKEYSIKANDSAQQFYLLYKSNTSKEITLADDLTTEICPPPIPTDDCETLEKKCLNGDSSSCDEYVTRKCPSECEALKNMCEVSRENSKICKEYISKCTNETCNTYVSNATCSNEDTNLYIKEGNFANNNSSNSTGCTSAQPNASNDQPTKCVIYDNDLNGNSYEATQLLSDNPYCSVWCKEDYHITLPGQKTATSGRYFTLQTQISGTKTCYTSKIKYDVFKKEYNDAISKYNKNKSTTTANAVNKIVTDYEACYNWVDKMNYTLEPNVEFWYEEKYMDSVSEKYFGTIGEIKNDGITTSYCSNDTNDSYTTCGNSYTWGNSTEMLKKCTANSCSNYTIKKVVRTKKEIKLSGAYGTKNMFQAIYPTGAIVVQNPNSEVLSNGEALYNSLPVGLSTAKGVYDYTLKVSNLGEYYNNSETGRIWGDENSVVANATASSCVKPNNNSTGLLNSESESKTNGGVYQCSYKVNCPDCPVVCVPGECELECPDCPTICENCIYNINDKINYRPISPNNINPNDRNNGANWNFDETNIKTALELKAYATTKEIEEDGESIYDVSFENTNSDDFAVKVKLNGRMISKIREYNKEKEEEGTGYLNNSLSCYDYKDGSTTYKNIFCYSTFLDELAKDFGENIEFTHERPTTESERKNYIPSYNGYFTTWSLADSSKWNVITEKGIAYYKEGYGTKINIGPSWK